MSLKHALVVDDSRLARMALKNQLEQHDLSVTLADSAEQALEFLRHEMVDVVFMDHVMPGMDGLEAVKAIKSDPRTATIPVMMYTSKEGEVYVSQARALGALDVLPKTVQPGVLFDMLLKLGLVRDRRAQLRAEPDETAPAAADETGDQEPQEEPAGMPMPALIDRILEDQQSTLRSEMLSTQRAFAKQVAREIFRQQKADELEAAEAASRERSGWPGWPILTAGLGVAALILGTLFVDMRAQRNAAQEQLTRMTAAVARDRQSSSALNEQLASEIGAVRTRTESAVQELLGSLVIAMNRTAEIPFDERPFNDARREQISGLMRQLMNVGFQGTVRVESHLGEFCLVTDSAGAYTVADPDQPVGACVFIGHPLDDSSSVAERQTPAFERFLEESPLIGDSGIELQIVARDRMDSVPLVPYPIVPTSAGEWNRIAMQNNRVEYSLFSRELP